MSISHQDSDLEPADTHRVVYVLLPQLLCHVSDGGDGRLQVGRQDQAVAVSVGKPLQVDGALTSAIQKENLKNKFYSSSFSSLVPLKRPRFDLERFFWKHPYITCDARKSGM